MSFASLIHLQASPSLLAAGFSVLLVLWLAAAEEAELRRDRPTGGAEG